MVDVIRVLNQTGLFDALSEAELGAIGNTADLVELPAGWEVIREGDIGDHLFVVVDGSLQVFTTTQDGQEIVLAKCEIGDYVGEQALLPGAGQRRNASVRTYDRSTLLRIHKADFRRVLAKNKPLKEQLLSAGAEQMKANMLKQSSIFRALELEDAHTWSSEHTYPDQAVIFAQGDAGDYYYLILAGEVAIYQETGEDGKRKLLTQLEAGQGFGELALLKQSPRQATAMAVGEVHVQQIDGGAFRDLYQQTPELREYIQTLQKVYPLAGYGFITQHTGKFMDMDSITTMFHLADGRTAVSSYVIGRDIFTMNFLTAQQPHWETVHYQNGGPDSARELVLDGDLIVGVTAYNLWEELGKVHRMMLTQTPISADELASFRESGRLSHEEGLIYDDADIVCECLQVPYGSILDVMKQGVTTVDGIADTLGCTTVCGSCRPQIREILGEGGWVPVLVTEEYEVVPGIRSFRFEPCGNAFAPSKPGQHIVIKAPIDGCWVQRPYTISSASNEVAYREVTIKREPHGYFSNWIFDQRDPNIVLQISDPQGDYFVDMANTTPIVCFVAGIGMTPALAILRTLVEEHANRPLYIDYSARTADDFVRRDDIQQMADAHASIQVNFRATSDNGWITQDDVNAIMQRYPAADIYICGPSGYQTAMEAYLKTSGIPAERINVEEFVPVGGAPDASAAGNLLSGQIYVLVGGLLLLIFLLQYTFGIKWSGLENAQDGETFKRWTGVALIAFILFQWYLPFLRWQGRLKAAARQYHWHKLIGAFSPVVYFIHSTTLGYAYTLALSLVYFGNFTLGLVNQEILPDVPYKKQYANYWLATHIILSTSMISLILYHIFVVFAYK